MKYLVLAVCAIVMASSPLLADQKSFPLLVKKIGGLANNGIATTCEIYSNHPEVIPNLDKINQLIDKAQAESELELVAQFIVAQVPSIEVYAIKAVETDALNLTGTQKVDLVEVYGAHEARVSDAAKELVELVQNLCN